MVFPFLLGSTLLRTQRLHLPQTFRRYKSLTQSIERGRQGGPDRPLRPRTREPPNYADDGERKTRAELRLERFGPAREDGDAPRRTRDERPSRDREERVTSPRSSRFGRVGPPRPRSDAPSRFSDDRPPRDRSERAPRDRDEKTPRDRDDRPQRRDDPFGRSAEGAGRGGRFESDRRPPSDRFGGRDTPRFGAGDRPPRTERFGGRDDRFGGRGERPPREPFQDRDRKPFGSEERRPWETRGGQSDRKPFDSQERRPWADRFSQSDRKPFDRESRYDAREGRPERPDRPDRPDRSERPYRPFRARDEQAPYQRERPERVHSERFTPREPSATPYDRPPRTAVGEEGPRSSAREPESLPYTTAASEFIYGYSSVLAAMKANRRKLYKLYVHSRGASRDGLLAKIRALKLFPITEEVGDEYLRAMDKASSGRPHNGVILESSPLPVPPIIELKTPSLEDESFSVALDTQSAEDALVNGKQELYSYKSAGWRHPLILYVDGVVNPLHHIHKHSANTPSSTKATSAPSRAQLTSSASTPSSLPRARSHPGATLHSKPPRAPLKPYPSSKSARQPTSSARARARAGEYMPAHPLPQRPPSIQMRRKIRAAMSSIRLRAARNAFPRITARSLSILRS
jgi:21S rRNA (GM2251-2'-O)-methyltransferase